MAVFYVPLDPRAFAEANPAFAPAAVPAAPGLVFDPSCQSCAEPTDHVAHIVTGTRLGTRSESFDQPVYLCRECLADQGHSRRRLFVVRAARVVVAVVAATVASAALRAVGVSEITATAAWLLLVPAVYMLGAVAVRGPRTVGRWQAVEVFWFRDPRKGEGAEFLCVRIDNPDQADRFRALNPHAIGADRWDASYVRSD